MNWQHRDVYAKDSRLCLAALAEALTRGELALFLGAGVSKPFGLPSWPELIRLCCARHGIDSSRVLDDASFDALTAVAGQIRAAVTGDAELHATVRACLYSADHQSRRTKPSPMLSAIGALTMGSKRGRIREVWTLNYDDMLEWYLRMHGFVAQVVTRAPSLLRDPDVMIFHPHGFLPFDERNGPDSSELVFTDTSYAKRSLKVDESWRVSVQRLLRTRILIVIGMSWTDLLIKQLMMDASTEITERPIAFWFFKSEANDPDLEQCLRHNVVPITFKSYDDMPAFLLGTCERAGANLWS